MINSNILVHRDFWRDFTYLVFGVKVDYPNEKGPESLFKQLKRSKETTVELE